MTPASLAGFALVFLVSAWTLSATAALVLARAGARLERLGPLVERRAAEAAAIVPIVLAGLVVMVLVLQSLLGADHCEAHAHHAHLCLVHGAAWTHRTWVVVVLAVAGAAVLARLALVLASVLRGARSLRALHAISREAGAVRLVESERAFGFVSGHRPATIYVSTRAWTGLSVAEQRALIAHELAHVRHGDLRMRGVLEACLVLAAPLVGDPIRARWLLASERLCDAHAAEVTGDPASVASALVALCRLETTRLVAALGFTPTAADLAHRVRAVLAGRPLGVRPARLLGRSVLAVSVLLGGAAVLAAETLHHAFETLLG